MQFRTHMPIIFMSSLLTMTAKSVHDPSFVPCGTPPLTCFHDDSEEPMGTACVRLVKERIQKKQNLIDVKNLSSSSKIEWRIISKPLEKSEKNNRTEQFPESIAS